MGRVLCFYLFAISVLDSCNPETSVSEWRGPNRHGIYSETGLLKEWPEKGPNLLWSYEGIGEGHSSPGIGKDKIFINGMPDTTGVLFCFDMEGQLLWEKEYGEEWHLNFTGSRSSPLVVGEFVYLESGLGKVCCFKVNDGELVWSIDLKAKFGALDVKWGLTESLLIDGNAIFCTPGGPKHNVVALNRFTGETVWTCEGFKEQSAYCSPVLIEFEENRLLVTQTASSVLGIDAETGELLWRREQNQRNKIHANSPIYKEGVLYCSSSSDKTKSGMLALSLARDGKKVQELWRNEVITNLMGGNVVRDGFIYGSKYRSNEWYAINCADGSFETIADDFKNGVITYADGLFYCYNEDGVVALINMTPDSFQIKGSFKVPLGENQHWSHPVIHSKKMYIRHGTALMVFDIKANS